MVVSGDAQALAKLQVSANDQALLIVNDAAKDDRFFSRSLDITLYTSKPLTGLTGKAGIKIVAPACAVDPSRLAVAGSMGTDIQIEGKTGELVLDLAMGGTFNKEPLPFTADVANVRMSMGAQSSLCNVPGSTAVSQPARNCRSAHRLKSIPAPQARSPATYPLLPACSQQV